MARCDCAGGRCSCAVIAGPGVEITGSGEASNPYQISAIGQDITGKLTVSDTATLELSRQGEGTTNEPYNINGVVKISPLIAAGANITLTGNGTMDEPYIIVGDETDEITGLIQQGLNVTITGTGTTADPYVINAADGGTATSIEGLIQAGANVTLTGGGTTASPYVIAVSTDVTPTAITGLIGGGSRVTITGDGTTASPYLINTSSIAGQVTAGTNVQRTGTGTTANPYVFSSVQGTYNLEDVFGTGTATDGQVLMFDTDVQGGRWVPRQADWMGIDPTARAQYYMNAQVNWDPPSIAHGSQVSTTVTVPGVQVSAFWIFHVACGSAMGGVQAWANVTAADIVTIYLSNMTGAAVNLGNRTFRVLGWR